MSSHRELEGAEFTLLEHEEHDVGTKFSHFGYCGSSPDFLAGGADLTGIRDAVMAIVLEDPIAGVSEPLTSQCKVRLLPMRGDKLDVNIIFDVSGGTAEFSFFIDGSGGILNKETRWLNLLRNCMRLAVLFQPRIDSPGYLVKIDDPDDEGRKTLVAATSQLPYYAWQGTGRISILG
jgi:hypothetical protein